jgi:hypothetical protein
MLPFATLGARGVMAILCRLAPVIVTSVVPVTAPTAAEIVEVPIAIPVASPWFGAVLPMVAMLAFDEDQVACVVRSWVVLSV